MFVDKNNSLLIRALNTPTACANVSTGSITVTANNGVGPYLFQLDGGNIFISSPTNTYTYTNVSGGPHIINAIDAVNCHATTMTVTVGAGAGSNGNITGFTASSCTDVANGTLTVAATQGTAPFTWQLDGGPLESGSTPHVFTNVSSGSHIVTIRDAIGCERVLPPFTVPAGPGADGSVVFTPASCQGIDNGTITITRIIGIPPFTFQLDGGSFVPGPLSHTFTNISGGLHTVVIKDNVGCSKAMNVTVTSGPPLTANTSSIATTCNGASNGSITINPTNGTGPYRFSLDGNTFVTGSIPFTFSNLSSGLHTIVYKDAPGCTSNGFVVNVVPGPGITTTVAKTNARCKNGATGSITIAQPSLGIPPFEYSLDGVNWTTNNVFLNLTANTYTAHYRSSNGCNGSQQVIITEPTQLAATQSVVPVTCFGESNGMITVNASGGIGPYTFSNNGGPAGTWQNTNTFTGPAGLYTIHIKDANSCITTTPALITEPALLTAHSSNSNASCDGGDDGRIVVSATGGNANYRYSIDGVNYQALNIFNVAPGAYTIKVKDEKGCTTSFNTSVGLQSIFF